MGGCVATVVTQHNHCQDAGLNYCESIRKQTEQHFVELNLKHGTRDGECRAVRVKTERVEAGGLMVSILRRSVPSPHCAYGAAEVEPFHHVRNELCLRLSLWCGPVVAVSMWRLGSERLDHTWREE